MATGLSYSWNAWRGDLFGLVAVAEFCRTNWRGIAVAAPSDDDDDLFSEINDLISKARDLRVARAEEILQQDGPGFGAFFAQLLALTPGSHPNTLKILEMAARVGEVVAIWFKLRFNRARPQQVFPGLMPMLPPPGHASYPSGHALQSRLIALALAQVYDYAGHERPVIRTALITLSSRIAENREIAGVHFKTDSECGQAIAEAAMAYLQICPTYLQIRTLAREEPAAPLVLTPAPECGP
ncbi:phosphatase PAP2 family protein [Reyranella sp.]|uniref:phosphatase PAP2 family protein n=1 Tax=Reyranella sp. TaxID=1929291 RepID=UPI003D131BE3